MSGEPRAEFEKGGAPMDYPEHDRMFELFIDMTKYGTIFVVVVLILMAIFLL